MYFFTKTARNFLTQFICYKHKCLCSIFFTINVKHGVNKNIKTCKYKFSSQLPVGSGQKPLSHCVTAPLSWEPKNRRFKAVPEREGGKPKV